jgi:glutathione S-transferase
MKLTLFYAPTACSLVPYVALTEAGAAFDVTPINLGKGEHTTPEFRRLNPKQAVPVLLIDDQPLTENVAIQIWIARNFPAAELLPRDPLQEIKAIAFLSWCASGIHPRLTPNALPQRFCDLPGSEDSVRRCAQKLLLGNYAIAEEMLADGRDWFFERFSTADVYFFWTFRRGMQFGIDVARFVHCNAHFQRMTQRPSVQQLVAFEKATLDQFARAS